MGIYLNPPENGANPHKDRWLALKVAAGEAVPCDVATFRNHVPGQDGKYGIVFVDNGAFDAIGVAFDRGEALAFTDPRDTRELGYFLVPEDKIKEWDANAYSSLQMTKR
jgi:hypothetical protein